MRTSELACAITRASCVEKMKVVFSVRLSSFIKSKMFWPVTESRFAVGSSASTSTGCGVLFVYQNDHPHANCAAVVEQGRAMDPTWPALALAALVCASQPANFGRHATTFSQRGAEVGAYAAAASNAIEEGRLQDSWHAEAWGNEEDAQRWCRADEEILQIC